MTSPFFATVVAFTVAIFIWALCNWLAYGLIFPVLSAAFSLNLDTASFTLKESELESTVFLGNLYSLLIAAFVTAWVLLTFARLFRSNATNAQVECPACLSLVPAAASRCRFCTEALEPATVDALDG